MLLYGRQNGKLPTIYTLQVRGGIRSSTVRRLKANESASANMIDALCEILECMVSDTISDTIEYFPNKKI